MTAPIDSQLAELDLALFDGIASQTSDDDKRSLLACEAATRTLRPGYRYLEIGSYLGGSLQPHLADPLCSRIYSIDKRPATQPDNSGLTIRFPDNSTERMLATLGEAGHSDLEKLTCVEGETRSLDPSLIDEPVDLCFIDGEHTDRVAKEDFEFCLSAVGEGGAIVFHDAQLIYSALSEVIESLRASGR
jgi:predicted O-methyltransferase YrrM